MKTKHYEDSDIFIAFITILIIIALMVLAIGIIYGNLEKKIELTKVRIAYFEKNIQKINPIMNEQKLSFLNKKIDFLNKDLSSFKKEIAVYEGKVNDLSIVFINHFGNYPKTIKEEIK